MSMFRNKKETNDENTADVQNDVSPSESDYGSNPEIPDAPEHSPATKVLSAEAISALYREIAPSLYRYALLLCRNVSLAEDAVQETFVRYYVRRSQGELEAERAWLFRVLRNYILDQQKSAQAKLSVGLEEARFHQDESLSPDMALEFSLFLSKAVEILTAREFQCVQLRYEGFSYKEIGDILSIESGTVGAMLARGSEKIRKAFGENQFPCEAV